MYAPSSSRLPTGLLIERHDFQPARESIKLTDKELEPELVKTVELILSAMGRVIIRSC
jgi:hypothetical protein